MPQTINKDKARMLAQEYCSNGFCKAAALRAVGYSDALAAKSRSAKIFDNPIVRVEIDKIMDANAAVCDVQVEEIVQGLRSIAFPAEGVKVKDSDRNAALAHLGKFKKMFVERWSLEVEDAETVRLTGRQKIEAAVLAELALRYGPEIRAEIEKRMAASASFTDADILSGEGDKNGDT